MSEFKLLPPAAILDLAHYPKTEHVRPVKDAHRASPPGLPLGEALLATSSNSPCGLDRLVGIRPSVAGCVMVSHRQWFSWDEATFRAKWDSAQVLCAEVARTRPFDGLASGLSTSAYRQLKLDGQSQKEDRKAIWKPM
eukprot:2258718-Amphidinium_carterae.1